MLLNIASFAIEIRSRPSLLFKFPGSFYSHFDKYLGGKRGRVDFSIFIVPYECFSLLPKKLVRRQCHLYYEKKDTFIIKSKNTIARVDTATRKISIGFRFKNSVMKNNAVLMGFVRLALSLLAVMKGGLPFHSSALCCGGRAIAFSGPSGAGKSTIAGLLVSPWRLLNDDFNIILPFRKNAYKIYSTPFTQLSTLATCVKSSGELRAVFFIKKHAANKIENLDFKNKYVLLLGQTYIFPLSDFFGSKILENAEKIGTNVPCKLLYFINNGSVRPFVHRFIKGLT